MISSRSSSSYTPLSTDQFVMSISKAGEKLMNCREFPTATKLQANALDQMILEVFTLMIL